MSLIYFMPGIYLLSVLSRCPLQRGVRKARVDCIPVILAGLPVSVSSLGLLCFHFSRRSSSPQTFHLGSCYSFPLVVQKLAVNQLFSSLLFLIKNCRMYQGKNIDTDLISIVPVGWRRKTTLFNLNDITLPTENTSADTFPLMQLNQYTYHSWKANRRINEPKRITDCTVSEILHIIRPANEHNLKYFFFNLLQCFRSKRIVLCILK